MNSRISLVAYDKGATAFFHKDGKTNIYHRIGRASIARFQRVGYYLVLDHKAKAILGIDSPYVRWAVEF